MHIWHRPRRLPDLHRQQRLCLPPDLRRDLRRNRDLSDSMPGSRPRHIRRRLPGSHCWRWHLSANPVHGCGWGASLAGFCILNGTEAAGGSSSCALDMFCGSADPTQLCIAGQICATTGVGRACSTLCATPGQTGSCTGGQQCNFLFPGYSSAGYCGACMPVEGRCFADADCCNGSCRNGSCSLVIAGGACTPGTVPGAFQSCASGSDCTCPQLCVDVGIGTGVCETPCPGAAPGTFGGACQVVTAGDGTCQPSQVNHPDGGVSLAGFCIPNGTETADGSSDCSVQEAEEFPPATPAELCVAGQICPAISQACATFCATPGQAGSCTAGRTVQLPLFRRFQRGLLRRVHDRRRPLHRPHGLLYRTELQQRLLRLTCMTNNS